MPSKVKDIDKGFKQLFKEISKFGNKRIKIGIQGSAATEKKEFTDSNGTKKTSSVDLVTVATANEFGTETIPERSFLRSTLSKNEKLNFQRLSEVRKLIITNKLDADVLLKKVGAAVEADVKTTITEGGNPYIPNTDSTISKKGSSSPLIDTGQLRQSITYSLEKVSK